MDVFPEFLLFLWSHRPDISERRGNFIFYVDTCLNNIFAYSQLNEETINLFTQLFFFCFQTYCEHIGARLLNVETSTENIFIKSFISDLKSIHLIFIGSKMIDHNSKHAVFMTLKTQNIVFFYNPCLTRR